MLYLLQDCYKDSEGNYHDILKVGYSSKSFIRSRGSQYKTHNFGYKFLGEKEGSVELEGFIHRLFKNDRLDGEWFKYSEDLINKFWSVSEDDISSFSTQEDLNEYVRNRILTRLVRSGEYLKKKHLDSILLEISKMPSDVSEGEYNKHYCKLEILSTFKLISSKERIFYEMLDFSSEDVIDLLGASNLILSKNANKEGKDLEDSIVKFYKTVKPFCDKFCREEFDLRQDSRRESSMALLSVLDKHTEKRPKRYIDMIRNQIFVSKFRDDFISISTSTGLPVYNMFLDISGEKAWEAVSNEEYLDPIEPDLTKITKPLSEYKISIIDTSNDKKLIDAVYLGFQEGEYLTEGGLIYRLTKIYRDLGIYRNPEVSDICKYFEIERATFTDYNKEECEGIKLLKWIIQKY